MGFASDVLDVLRRERDKFPNEKSFATACGLHAGTVNRWMNGQRTPSIADAGKVFDALQLFYRFRRIYKGNGPDPQTAELLKAQAAEIERLKREVYGLEKTVKAYETALRIAAGREAAPQPEGKNAQK